MQDDFVQRFLGIRIAGRYQLLERLGEGTFGLVYLGRVLLASPVKALAEKCTGRDTATGDQVAIKLEHYRIVPSFLD